MNGHYWIRCHYVDASALVKLVADDDGEKDGREDLRRYYWSHTANMYATSHSVTEALAVLKGKYKRGDIDRETYSEYVDRFLTRTIGGNLRVEDDEEIVPILSTVVRDESRRLIERYDIDFLDAFQLVVIMRGKFRHMVGASQTLLISADRGLAKAALAEGLASWCCLDASEPPRVEAPGWLRDQE